MQPRRIALILAARALVLMGGVTVAKGIRLDSPTTFPVDI